jgi:hypothetical protein
MVPEVDLLVHTAAEHVVACQIELVPATHTVVEQLAPALLRMMAV